jgi:hypothetical protein
MIRPMKSLWMLCVLGLGLSLAGACGPQEQFCPNTGSNMNGKCPILGDDAMARQFDSGAGNSTGNLCPVGEHGVAVGDAIVCM